MAEKATKAPRKARKSEKQQTKWGPYIDYEFVTTPYGEYAVPAGLVMHFEMGKDDKGNDVPLPVYEGEPLTTAQRIAIVAEMDVPEAEEAAVTDGDESTDDED